MVGPLQGNSPMESVGQLIRARSGLIGMNGAIRGSIKGVSQILPIDPVPLSNVIKVDPGIQALTEPKGSGNPTGLGRHFDRKA